MGGEPLLNKDIGEIIIRIRELLPLSNIIIVTNGLLLPKLDVNILKTIKENDVSFDVSEYKPTKKIVPKIISLLNEWDIRYRIKSMKSDAFYKLFQYLCESLHS